MRIALCRVGCMKNKQVMSLEEVTPHLKNISLCRNQGRAHSSGDFPPDVAPSSPLGASWFIQSAFPGLLWFPARSSLAFLYHIHQTQIPERFRISSVPAKSLSWFWDGDSGLSPDPTPCHVLDYGAWGEILVVSHSVTLSRALFRVIVCAITNKAPYLSDSLTATMFT